MIFMWIWSSENEEEKKEYSISALHFRFTNIYYEHYCPSSNPANLYDNQIKTVLCRILLGKHDDMTHTHTHTHDRTKEYTKHAANHSHPMF